MLKDRPGTSGLQEGNNAVNEAEAGESDKAAHGKSKNFGVIMGISK